MDLKRVRYPEKHTTVIVAISRTMINTTKSCDLVLSSRIGASMVVEKCTAVPIVTDGR
jgi:hypothetical protein